MITACLILALCSVGYLIIKNVYEIIDDKEQEAFEKRQKEREGKL